MKISRIDVNRFKRFTETSIRDIPPTARLVMLVGPNGCGKSSLIEAVYSWYGRVYSGMGLGWDPTYHEKQEGLGQVDRNEAVKLWFHDPQPTTDLEKKKAVYVRSAYRNDPEFEIQNLTRSGPAVEERRFSRLIENDQAVSKNYQRLVSKGFADMFDPARAGLTLGAFTEEILAEIRDATQRLFPGLKLNDLGDPLAGGTFKFDKGSSRSFLYKNLSGGEKAAFDLLLDLVVKRREFDNTVFFIDEPEAHIAARLQADLLEELLDLVPDSSQLWISTHSIGMMRKAKELANKVTGSVAFLDFDGRDFDAPQVIAPSTTDRPFWKRALQVAIDDLSDYVAPREVILCEGGTLSSAKRDFDAACYNVIFQDEFPDCLFLGVGSAKDVEADTRAATKIIQAVASGVRVSRVIDRDDRADVELAELNARGVAVLTRRNLESYLLSDDVLTVVCERLGKLEAAAELIRVRDQEVALVVARGGPGDDYKDSAGAVYLEAKRRFPLAKLGNDAFTFLKAYCAPAVTRDSPTYVELRATILGR